MNDINAVSLYCFIFLSLHYLLILLYYVSHCCCIHFVGEDSSPRCELHGNVCIVHRLCISCVLLFWKVGRRKTSRAGKKLRHWEMPTFSSCILSIQIYEFEVYMRRSIFISQHVTNWIFNPSCTYTKREKYPERIQKNVEHRQHLQQFFDDLKDESKKDFMNKRLDGFTF